MSNEDKNVYCIEIAKSGEYAKFRGVDKREPSELLWNMLKSTRVLIHEESVSIFLVGDNEMNAFNFGVKSCDNMRGLLDELLGPETHKVTVNKEGNVELGENIET